MGNIAVAKNQISDNRISDKEWDALISRFGYAGATRFVMLLEQGHGDSVEEIKRIWGNKTSREIHEEIMKAKKDGVI